MAKNTTNGCDDYDLAHFVDLPRAVVARIEQVIAKSISRSTSTLGNDQPLTPEEIAKILRLPTRYVRSMMAEGKLPGRDVPGVGLRCTVDALRRFIRSHVGKAAEPTDDQPRQGPQ